MLAAENITSDPEIDHVQHLLSEWARSEMAWRPPLGAPGCSTIVRLPMRASVSCGMAGDALDEPYMYSEAIDKAVLSAVAAAVEDLPLYKRCAVRVIYLREAIAAVFRSNRISLEQAALLCAEAERDLIPKLRARNVVVAGR